MILTIFRLITTIYLKFFKNYRSNYHKFLNYHNYHKNDENYHGSNEITTSGHTAFGPRSRYRKKPPAAVANQIAGNKKISLGMHK